MIISGTLPDTNKKGRYTDRILMLHTNSKLSFEIYRTCHVNERQAPVRRGQT